MESLIFHVILSLEITRIRDKIIDYPVTSSLYGFVALQTCENDHWSLTVIGSELELVKVASIVAANVVNKAMINESKNMPILIQLEKLGKTNGAAMGPSPLERSRAFLVIILEQNYHYFYLLCEGAECSSYEVEEQVPPSTLGCLHTRQSLPASIPFSSNPRREDNKRTVVAARGEAFAAHEGLAMSENS
ncbi:hypothetical protein RND71_012661 [Anisodus tanguticus]|uniref:Uncharacterized protein n=1 Tax=Anisodus tanguticus TaxID=243964 RepID=A0AAE1SG25_9SOLA|nr:hypothetical protein RND71_012661 [Anisodus tanguticus]